MAAESGHVVAQSELGSLYVNGIGILQNFVRGYMWLNIAAYRGDLSAADKRSRLVDQMSLKQKEKGMEISETCLEKLFKEWFLSYRPRDWFVYHFRVVSCRCGRGFLA